MASRESEAARIFLEAVEEHDPLQWAGFVQHAAAGDVVLAERVDALLRAHGQANPMLDAEQLLPTAGFPLPQERPGAMIGPYKLLEQIGEGGMGVVFMAEQARPLRRRVALKIIKPGMDTRQVITRFEAERQALALMDHPNIARVFDAGATESGRPYFVMELVRGVPITDYCDQRSLDIRQRLELFGQVCQAVHHAHQRGIIHRDLKPGNVLVAHDDTAPLPKIIDFGIAKATTQELTEHTLFTAFAQVVGSPLYMSPEQASQHFKDVDTRSDVYSLGVLLYELLTGSTPFERERLRQVGLDEVRRIIQEEEPPRPSARVTTLGAALETVSERRGVDPRRISLALRGELDWIVLKALEKDRNRRYESVSALAADVQRHLKNESVEACPPSTSYWLRKYVRRNRRVLAPACLIAAVLVVATGISTWLAIDASMARREAATDAAIARSVNDFLAYDLLSQVNVGWHLDEGFRPDRNLTVHEALDRAVAKIPERFRDQPLVEAAIREAIGDAYGSGGQSELAVNHFERALFLRRAHRGLRHPDTLKAIERLASSYAGNGQLREALALYAESLELFMATIPESEITAGFLSNYGGACHKVGKLVEAESLLRAGAAIWLKNYNEYGAACSLAKVTRIQLMKKQFSAAEQTAREALTHLERDPQPRSPSVVLGLLGDALLGQDKYEDARPLLFQAYEGLKERDAIIGATTQDWRVTEASERIARFYEATNQPEKAAAFRESVREKTRKN